MRFGGNWQLQPWKWLNLHSAVPSNSFPAIKNKFVVPLLKLVSICRLHLSKLVPRSFGPVPPRMRSVKNIYAAKVIAGVIAGLLRRDVTGKSCAVCNFRFTPLVPCCATRFGLCATNTLCGNSIKVNEKTARYQ